MRTIPRIMMLTPKVNRNRATRSLRQNAGLWSCDCPFLANSPLVFLYFVHSWLLPYASTDSRTSENGFNRPCIGHDLLDVEIQPLHGLVPVHQVRHAL